jgi:hypothetical protein
MADYEDFQEIAHCGGRATFQIQCDQAGNRSYSLGFQHDRPTPASWIGIYASAPQAIPVSDFRIGGIGQGFGPQPQPGWYPVFLGSDSRQCWGHQCPRCQGYFRNGVHPAIYPLTCPYCGLRTGAYKFLTPAQRVYVRHYLDTLLGALEAEMEPGTGQEIVIDMDAIADRGADQPKPDFYYTAETQQTRYKCDHCGEFNDIRGRFGYCASCGWRNNAQSLKASFSLLREKLNAGQAAPIEVVKLAVSEFDASCRDMATQVVRRIPMKPARKAEFQRLIFHDLESATIDRMRSMFDIDLLRGIDAELGFARMMFHRRHIYEHNAGVADARYVQESGDPDAREGVLLREIQANAHRLVGILTRITENFDSDFHDIFQPTEWPTRRYQERQARRMG